VSVLSPGMTQDTRKFVSMETEEDEGP
jgi:hypothetical protein